MSSGEVKREQKSDLSSQFTSGPYNVGEYLKQSQSWKTLQQSRVRKKNEIFGKNHLKHLN